MAKVGLQLSRLNVKRDMVLDIMRIIDPDGIERRKRRRLIRRKYNAPCPNFIWYVDGYDKLKPFGFAIHGAIDGYSRRVLWIEVCIGTGCYIAVISFDESCANAILYGIPASIGHKQTKED